MSSDREEDIDRLITRIASLEIENKILHKEVRNIKKALTKSIAATKAGLHATQNRKNKEVYFDRYGEEVDIGDKVYIITPGAFTHISRRGVVTGFDRHRDRVYVRDEAGNPQERAVKNVKLEERADRNKKSQS